jgi:hypothetical protein
VLPPTNEDVQICCCTDAGQTTGAVISFNLEGEDELREKAELAEIFRYFDTVRNKGANAFVFKLLQQQCHLEGDRDISGSNRRRSWWRSEKPDPHSDKGAKWGGARLGMLSCGS